MEQCIYCGQWLPAGQPTKHHWPICPEKPGNVQPIDYECEDCREAKEDVETRTDPYDAEILEIVTWVRICNDCYHERGMEI